MFVPTLDAPEAIDVAPPTVTLLAIGRFVRRVVPDSTEYEAQDRRADAQQIGVAPNDSAYEDGYSDRHDRPSRRGLNEIV